MGLTNMMVKKMTEGGAAVKNHLFETTKHPEEEQKKLLFELIENAKDTEFGKAHDFASIKDVEDFRARVPYTGYDDYAEYIEKMANGAENVLTAKKIVHFNKTSGTLGVPKMIPVTDDHIKIFSDYHGKYLSYISTLATNHDWMKYKGFSLTEGTYKLLPSGISFGSASSLMAVKMGKMVPWLKLDFVKGMYTSPIEARKPKSGVPTRYIHSRFALADRTVSYINVTFSSYLLEIMRYIEDNYEMIADDIEKGTIDEKVLLPEDVRASLLKKIKPMPERAAEIREIFSHGNGIPVMKRLWPNLSFIMCVGGAGFSQYTQKLRDRYCGNDMDFCFLGLTASEGLFSVPYEMNNTASVFVPDSVFLEFIPVDDESRCLMLHELEVGGKYEIVITNRCGLFRYRMKDTVKIVGKYNDTPTMEFLNRSGFAISMFGEKTSDMALQSTSENTSKELGLDTYDYAFYPDSESVPGKYVMFLELRGDSAKTDRELIRSTAEKYLGEANPSMADKFKTGVCGPLELKILQPETFLLYKDLMVMKGASAAQLKPVHVLNTPYQQKFFSKLTED